jgi:hypothetical protein
MMQRYMPLYAATYEDMGRALRGQVGTGPPAEFMHTYGGLGQRVLQGLSQGYELGDELSREVEQGIRAGQTARGNYLGPALVAEEAFGRGQAALNLYNQRLGQAQTYLQGKNPEDIRQQQLGMLQNWLQGRNPSDVMGGMAQSFMGQQYYPQNTYVDTGLGLQGAGIQQQGMSAYNATLNEALQAYNQNQLGAYDKRFDQYLYNQAVQHGLYSMPGAMGGGGGMGLMGMLGGGAGLLGGAMSGIAGAGVLGGGATAGIVGGIGAGLAAF